MHIKQHLQQHALTSIFGTVPCDCIDGQVCFDVTRADDRHLQAKPVNLSPQTVKVGLRCMFRCCILTTHSTIQASQ